MPAQPKEVFTDWVNGGVYVCGQRLLDYPDAQDFARDLFPAMLRDGRVLIAYPPMRGPLTMALRSGAL